MTLVASFNRELPSSKSGRAEIDADATFAGGQTGADIKHEFYQLLATTVDPLMVSPISKLFQ